ncbi:MAG: creatininase family protein [Gemmatimonadota bacterium]
MALLNLSGLTWEEVRDLDPAKTIAILPIGAIEAHGPHLPLGTDVLISEAMARDGGERLAARGYEVLLLPSLAYTAAGFAAAFPGTLSVNPETVTALLLDVAGSLSRHGIATLALANSHLDPAHRDALQAALEGSRRQDSCTIVFPDIASRPWAPRLTDEFRSGACHAGRYESSVVLAVDPGLVREEIRHDLPANARSLSAAIREGKSSFEEADGPRAYFGDPAAATADEGRRTIHVLGAILEEAVLAVAPPAERTARA